MSQEESKKLIEENLKWLHSIVSVMPDLSFIEPTVQSLAILNSSKKYDEIELMTLGVVGFVMTKARIVDEKKFQTISPNDYMLHAYFLLTGFKKIEASEEVFLALMQKIYK